MLCLWCSCWFHFCIVDLNLFSWKKPQCEMVCSVSMEKTKRRIIIRSWIRFISIMNQTIPPTQMCSTWKVKNKLTSATPIERKRRNLSSSKIICSSMIKMKSNDNEYDSFEKKRLLERKWELNSFKLKFVCCFSNCLSKELLFFFLLSKGWGSFYLNRGESKCST